MKAGRARRVPVLVGVGVATQRIEDPLVALEPIELMTRAVRQAGEDCGFPAALSGIQRILVPQGRWRYGDPGRELARRFCAGRPTSVLAKVGVLQQSLVADACSRIADGEIDVALVAGGEAGYRLARARRLGVRAPDLPLAGEPASVLSAAEDILHPAELRAGLRMPVELYAILESAFRASRGRTLTGHARSIAELYSRFSAVAAVNPHAWSRKSFTPEELLDASDRNPVQAEPYRRRHCSSWSVDQAAALLFCSEEKARALGMDPSRWIYPWASTESNNMQPVCVRDDLAAFPPARIAGRAALQAGQLGGDDLDFVELYSCFPVAVETVGEELGLQFGRDLTVTGGMASAGGPFNNYVLQATCRMAELLRRRPGGKGLVSSVSGILTKPGFGLWSSAPHPDGFRFADMTQEAARLSPAREVADEYEGQALAAGYTVVPRRDAPPRSIVVADTPERRRVVVASEDPAIASLISREELCGLPISVNNGQFHLPGRTC